MPERLRNDFFSPVPSFLVQETWNQNSHASPVFNLYNRNHRQDIEIALEGGTQHKQAYLQ